ncbi:hypothetical protein LQZ21_09035 [Treponema sp. TIM-1]|uniref:hypothetical protein n=1 Tax=Treponema sp. TIM-1 TaxID=2898417 RepID=UPI00397FE5AB
MKEAVMAAEAFRIKILAGGKELNLWSSLLENVLKLPGAKVDRLGFLEKEFSKHCNLETMRQIKELGTGKAKVEEAVMDKVSAKVITDQTVSATTLSFVSGLPGGLAMLGTIPVDLAQYYYNLVVTAQKLAYIYGWPDLEGEEPDGLLSMLTVFIGIMTGTITANRELTSLSKELEGELVKRLSCVTLAKVGILLLAKHTAGILGAKLFWQGYTGLAAKTVPLIGGFVSGGITLMTFLPMANTCKNQLRKIIIH